MWGTVPQTCVCGQEETNTGQRWLKNHLRGTEVEEMGSRGC